MDDYFFDSSALVKNYGRERGSVWVQNILTTESHVYVSRLTEVEVASAIARKLREGLISQENLTRSLARLRADFADRFTVLDVTGSLIQTAIGLLSSHNLRAYDAIQLATALLIRDELVALNLPVTFLSADAGLNAAALAQGLTVDDPNAHP